MRTQGEKETEKRPRRDAESAEVRGDRVLPTPHLADNGVGAPPSSPFSSSRKCQRRSGICGPFDNIASMTSAARVSIPRFRALNRKPGGAAIPLHWADPCRALSLVVLWSRRKVKNAGRMPTLQWHANAFTVGGDLYGLVRGGHRRRGRRLPEGRDGGELRPGSLALCLLPPGRTTAAIVPLRRAPP